MQKLQEKDKITRRWWYESLYKMGKVEFIRDGKNLVSLNKLLVKKNWRQSEREKSGWDDESEKQNRKRK
jgi:hypothetical protein